MDAVICATGFNTSFTPDFRMVGRNNIEIHEAFADFPMAYLGVTAPDFPNLFLHPGPNGPVWHSSVIQGIEWYTRYAVLVIQMV